MEEKNKNRIDGFAISGGVIKQVITLKDGTYYFNFEYLSKDELIKKFKETIQNPEILDFNIKCLDDCVDMKWLTEEIHFKLSKEPDVSLKAALAGYSDKYHEQFKDDHHPRVRKIVAEYSDKYHKQFKDDPNWAVRMVVAKYSDKYHEYLKDDPNCEIREIVNRNKTKRFKNGKKIEIKNGIRIIDYSEGKGDLHIKFEHKGEEDDPNDNSQFNGSCFEFKFKDPRDALKELVKNWKLYDIEISLKLLDYINYGIFLGNFNPMQVYYNIILNFQIGYTLYFAICNPPFPEFKEDMTEKELKLYNKLIKEYEFGLNIQTRLSHIWAVKNTWWYYNKFNNMSKLDKELKDMENSTESITVGDIYLGKKVVEISGFLLTERLWKIKFGDGSWLIGFDEGDGWYRAVTALNSYKISE